jgi:cytochrome c oxidase assembly protein subunit 15
MTVIAFEQLPGRQIDAPARRAVSVWLFAMAALIFAMIIVGGATRLTDSGLSITEWQPILGAIPPMSDAAWQEAFDKYRQIPEYKLVNRGMSLDDFKFIYWWEWAHRFLGRIIGLAFFVPFVVFLARGDIRRREAAPFAALFVLGGLQGALGWWMVQSGLVDRVDVSQYRLAAHLSLAFLLFGAIFWLALDWSVSKARAVWTPLSVSAVGLCAAIYLQVALGGFVAGLGAGHAHNTWPLMDGEFIPSTVGVIEPWWRDMFENVSTVQFNHRLVAYLITLWALAHMIAAARGRLFPQQRISAYALGAGVIAQAALGVWTVVWAVPLALGLAHQGAAAILLIAALWHLHTLRRIQSH